VHPGKMVSAFAMGTRRLYDFIDDNPQVVLLDVAYVNDTAVIRRNPKVTAINSAIEVDLTGQICSDSIGTRIYSGFGGQVDFIRGAARSKGGKPIIALPATAKGNALSRITVGLSGPVTTARSEVDVIVTEFGAAELKGQTLAERTRRLIAIAHPDFREELERAAHTIRQRGF